MEIQWSSLGDVLDQIDTFDTFKSDGNGIICIYDEDLDSELALYQSCTVLYVTEKYDHNEYRRSSLLRENHLIDLCSVQTATDIVHNARQQRPNCTQEDLLQAFLNYFRNDAFYDFTKPVEPVPESLERILSNLNRYEEKDGGQYYLFAPRGFEGKHLPITGCLMYYVEDQEFENNVNFLPDVVIESKFYKVAALSLLKKLVAHALSRKPNPLNPVTALNHYILTGSFLESAD